VKEVAFKILNNGLAYVMRPVIMRFFPIGPDDLVVMELQCTMFYTVQPLQKKIRNQNECG